MSTDEDEYSDPEPDFEKSEQRLETVENANVGEAIVDDRFLRAVAAQLPGDTWTLGLVNLNLNPVEMRECDIPEQNREVSIFKMLVTWRKKYHQKSTHQFLLQCLACEENPIPYEYLEAIKKAIPSSFEESTEKKEKYRNNKKYKPLLNTIVKDKDLRNLASYFDGDWKDFAIIKLNITYEKLKRIEKEESKETDRIFNILIEWRTDKQEVATNKTLITLLKDSHVSPTVRNAFEEGIFADIINEEMLDESVKMIEETKEIAAKVASKKNAREEQKKRIMVIVEKHLEQVISKLKQNRDRLSNELETKNTDDDFFDDVNKLSSEAEEINAESESFKSMLSIGTLLSKNSLNEFKEKVQHLHSEYKKMEEKEIPVDLKVIFEENDALLKDQFYLGKIKSYKGKCVGMIECGEIREEHFYLVFDERLSHNTVCFTQYKRQQLEKPQKILSFEIEVKGTLPSFPIVICKKVCEFEDIEPTILLAFGQTIVFVPDQKTDDFTRDDCVRDVCRESKFDINPSFFPLSLKHTDTVTSIVYTGNSSFATSSNEEKVLNKHSVTDLELIHDTLEVIVDELTPSFDYNCHRKLLAVCELRNKVVKVFQTNKVIDSLKHEVTTMVPKICQLEMATYSCIVYWVDTEITIGKGFKWEIQQHFLTAKASHTVVSNYSWIKGYPVNFTVFKLASSLVCQTCYPYQKRGEPLITDSGCLRELSTIPL